VIATVYRLTLRAQARAGRLAAMAVLGLVGVVVGLAIGLGDVTDRLDAGTNLVNSFTLTVFAPVVVLVFASAALGDPVDDSTLVYYWLRPVPRWRIVAGAWLATLTITVPLVLVPSLVAAGLSGGGAPLLRGTLASALVAVAGYSGLFLLLGLLVRRALTWGLVYILLWEGFVALAGSTASRLALRRYTRSLLTDATGVPLRLAESPPSIAVVVPVVVAVVALVLTTWRLRRMEVA
jgi:ABC-2 type transport system permease protein